MAMTMRDITKSDGKIRFNANGVKYEYIPSERALWRRDGDQFTLSSHLTELDHQAILNASAGITTLSWSPGAPEFGQTLAPPKLDVSQAMQVTLGRIPRSEKGRVSGIGVMPVMQRVNFDKTYKRPASSNPFDVMPDTPKEMLDFVTNAIAVFGVIKRDWQKRPARRHPSRESQRVRW